MTLCAELTEIRNAISKAGQAELAARLSNVIVETDHALTAMADRIVKLEAVAQTLLTHRNSWFADQEEAMVAAGYKN
jgi:hypothetical protein